MYPIPYRLSAGGTAIVKGLVSPGGAPIARATLAWRVSGDRAGEKEVEQAILVEQ